jgi:hypothetical protein
MKTIIIPTIVLMILSSCSLISTNDRLTDKDLEYIGSLGLLDKNEGVQIFSSSMTKKTSGNFVTNKRIAAYWIDKDKKKSFKNFAYFDDIAKIGSMDLTQAWTYASYLIITKKDSSSFKVYIDGDRKEYSKFVNIAVDNWKRRK